MGHDACTRNVLWGVAEENLFPEIITLRFTLPRCALFCLGPHTLPHVLPVTLSWRNDREIVSITSSIGIVKSLTVNEKPTSDPQCVVAALPVCLQKGAGMRNCADANDGWSWKSHYSALLQRGDEV